MESNQAVVYSLKKTYFVTLDSISIQLQRLCLVFNSKIGIYIHIELSVVFCPGINL